MNFFLCRLRKSRVLICGINCLGNEVSKNVILAGVDHMTILDATVLSKDDAEIQFLPSSNSFGKNVWYLFFPPTCDVIVLYIGKIGSEHPSLFAYFSSHFCYFHMIF